MKRKTAFFTALLAVILILPACGNTDRIAPPTEESQREYARLLITVGCNLQEGQRLEIASSVDNADFARLCVEEAYKAGCKEVAVTWTDPAVDRLKYQYADDEVFDTANPWELDAMDTILQEGGATLALHSSPPHALEGVDADKVARLSNAKAEYSRESEELIMAAKVQWCVAAVPSQASAEVIYPELSPRDAYNKMWKDILHIARVDGENTAENWKQHSEHLRKQADTLNAYNFKTLVYKNSLGTDFSIDLVEGHYWDGAEKTANGIPFMPNIPTEEIYTSPDRNSANGIIYASMPLVMDGIVIEGLCLEVRDGKIMEAHAKTNEEYLKKRIATDEGACYLGEVALVPFDSPISNLGTVFYDILIDENASCHIAIGNAYPLVKNAEELSEEELRSLGLNRSVIHEDFMIGTEDLSITGITHDGQEIVIFENGSFAL